MTVRARQPIGRLRRIKSGGESDSFRRHSRQGCGFRLYDLFPMPLALPLMIPVTTAIKRRVFLTGLAWASAASGCGRLVAAKRLKPREPLAEHRIGAIEWRNVRLNWPRLVGKNARRDVHGQGQTVEIVVLKTDQDASGWGMIRGSSKTIRNVQERIIGKRVSDLLSPATGIVSEDFTSLDFALHDLAGVILDLPVWRLIGGTEPVLTKIYSGMIYFDDLEPPDKPAGIDQILEECRWDYNYGYRQFKVKIGRGNKWMPAPAGIQRDAEVVRAVAKAFPDCEILVDGNDGFNVDSVIEFLRGIDGVPLFWIEEPFRETRDDWRKLHAWMRDHGYAKTYRADGESSPNYAVLEPLCDEGVVNLRLEDIVGYGFTRWRALMPKLVRHGVAASPHTWGAGIKTVYVGHLAGALGNTPTIEGVTCSSDDIDFGDNKIEGGKFHPSSSPGFGMKLDGV